MKKRSPKNVNRVLADRDEGRIDDEPHRRRPRATADDGDRQLVAAGAVYSSQSPRAVRDDGEINVLTRAVQRIFAEAGLGSRIVAQEPLLSE